MLCSIKNQVFYLDFFRLRQLKAVNFNLKIVKSLFLKKICGLNQSAGLGKQSNRQTDRQHAKSCLFRDDATM